MSLDLALAAMEDLVYNANLLNTKPFDKEAKGG